MKKIYFLLIISTSAIFSFGQTYSRLTDSIFTYLQGDWYQSFRVYNGATCKNGIEKFALPPLKITYTKTSDTTGLVIKHSDEEFYSHYLNVGFKSDKRKDTLYMEWDQLIDEWLPTNSLGFNPSIQINSPREHLMVFYEYSWVGFERTPHRALATHLAKNNWEGGYCAIDNGQKLCLAMVTFADFFLRNDTLIYRSNGEKKFMFNHKEQVYKEIGADSVLLLVDIQDARVTVTDLVSFEAKYHMGQTHTIKSGNLFDKYLGMWTDLKFGGEVVIEIHSDTLVGRKDKAVLFSAFLMSNGKSNEYLSVLDQDNGCAPEYSRYEYSIDQNGNAKLKNYTTGDEFQQIITDVKDVAHGGSKSLLFTNPITTGKLVMDSLQEFDYEVFDLRGVSIMKGKTNDGQVSVESLNNGYHLMKVSQNDSVEILKFIKE